MAPAQPATGRTVAVAHQKANGASMPQIESIEVNVQTLDADGAGTDGSLYVGVCGREFHLDTRENDLQRGSAGTYVLGDNSNVQDKAINDPRNQRLFTENVDSLPVYLRFVGEDDDDHWGLQRAVLILNSQILPQWDTISYISQTDGIWLGHKAGNIVFLIRDRDEG
jgi:hypothetical protein